MKIKRMGIINFVCFLIALITLSITAFAASNYIKDDAGMLSSSTISQINDNFTKVETNTGAQVRIAIIKSLDGKNINDYAMNIAKTGTNSDKYAVFVVSVNDHKNKFLVGPGLNAVFTSSDTDKIANIPNDYFKKNDFNTGIMKVGQAIDQAITTKAVKSGKATVTNDGLSKTVQPKKNYTGVIIAIILIILAIIIIVYFIKKRADEKMKKFRRDNGVDDSSSGDDSFKSSNFSKNNNSYNQSNGQNNNQGYDSGRGNNTTIINNGNNNSGFVEGMIINEMLHNHNHNNHNNNGNNSNYNNNSSNDNEKHTSGDWNSGNGTSDWGNSNNSNSGSSDFGSGSSDNNSSGGSDW